MSENGEIYTAGKNFTLPPAVTAVTNSTSGTRLKNMILGQLNIGEDQAKRRDLDHDDLGRGG